MTKGLLDMAPMKQVKRVVGFLAVSVMLALVVFLFPACSTQPQRVSSVGMDRSGSLVSYQGMHRDFWKVFAGQLHLTQQYENNPSVQAQIRWMQRNPQSLQQMVTNAGPYIYYIAQQVASHKMPAELALMPMIESAYDPFRYSLVGATGLWDLMPGTASGLGVRIDWWYDGRRDVVSSTAAALSYLGYLHKHFKQWTLAIPAYDSGAGLVEKAIATNKKGHLSTQIWSLNLPIETKTYLPKLLAVAAIIRRPQHYGFNLPYLANMPQIALFHIHKQYDIGTLARVAGVSEQQFRRLNPGFRRWLPQQGVVYNCLVPINHADTFTLGLVQLSRSVNLKTQRARRYVVKSGDTLGGIAHHFHVRPVLIKQVNARLQRSTLLHKGQVVWIPTERAFAPAAGQSMGWAQQRNSKGQRIHSSLAEDGVPGPRQITYIVRKHDNFSTIAHRFHLKEREILFWNQLSPHHHLQPGEVLTLWAHHRQPEMRTLQTHTVKVKPGDSLYTIAHRNKMLLHALVVMNPQLGPKHIIHPGQWVHVAN